ncbi:MAG: hypothetical protein QXO27_03820 [Candidatus Aenigmatarchaeota archaeon]
MRKKIIALISVFIIFLILASGYYIFLKITGFVSLSNLDVTIKEKASGKILLAFKPFLEIGETQKIYAEFINTGTNSVTAKIEEKIYSYVNGSLKPLAYYYDTSIPLNPGMRRGYNTVFIPPYVGLYYIQAEASYDYKKVETWGAFSVYYPSVPTPPTLQPVTPQYIFPVQEAIGVPKLGLNYPEKVKISQGESMLISITASNVGNTTLHNLKLYFSTTSLINFTINPKQIASLAFNRSVIFLISVDVPTTTPEGIYPFDFELISDEIKDVGKITIEVIALPISEEEEIRQKILNFEFLISEIEHEIFLTSLEGFDVSLANQSLNNAKSNLRIAKEYFNLKKFEDTKRELEKVRKNLESAVLQLASATLYIYKPSAFVWWWIILIIILVIAGILIYYYYRKRKKKRPRLLRALVETELETEK